MTPIVLTFGRLTSVNCPHILKAKPPTVVTLGKLTFVKAELEKQLLPISISSGMLTSASWVQDWKT